jgi:hypothetical protein
MMKSGAVSFTNTAAVANRWHFQFQKGQRLLEIIRCDLLTDHLREKAAPQ